MCIEKTRAPRKSSQTRLTGYGARGIHGNGVRAFPRFMIEHLTGNDDLIRAGLFDEGAQAALDRILPADGRSAQHLVQHRLRSEAHTSELQSLMRISYAVFCLKKKTH